MRIKLKLENFTHSNSNQCLLTVPPQISTIAQLNQHLITKFQLNSHLILKIDNFTIFQDEKLQAIIQPDDVLQLYTVDQQPLKKIQKPQPSSSDSEESQIPMIKKKQIVTKPVAKTITKPVPTKPMITKKTIKQDSTSEDSSDDEPVMKKKVVTQSLKVRSPEEEFGEKQQQWKQTFMTSKQDQKSNEQPKVTQKQTNPKGQSPLKTQSPPQQAPKPVVAAPKPVVAKQQIPIVVEKYAKLEDPSLLKLGDKVQVKYTYLDLNTFAPMVSELKRGVVMQNGKDQLEIEIDNKRYKLYHSEITFLEVLQKEDQVKSDFEYKKLAEQVNYYYSEKNYNKDDFIQQHSSQHPEKYMALKLLLNFPRVKRVVDSAQKLREILENYEQINFELKQMEDGEYYIRKKQ